MHAAGRWRRAGAEGESFTLPDSAPRALARGGQARHHADMAERHLPPALRRRSDREAVDDDLEPYRGTDVNERSTILGALCRHAADVLNDREDGVRVLAVEEPRSQESEALWLRLVARARGR